jgi:hypothetical protein
MRHRSAQNHSVRNQSAEPTARKFHRRASVPILGAAAIFVLALAVVWQSPAFAAAPINLGTAAPYSVLAGSTVTNTGPSILPGNLGVSPGSAITGFPPGLALAATNAANALAVQAQLDVVTAYNEADARPMTTGVSGDLAGLTLTEGVYTSSSTLGLNGAVTLNGQGNFNSIFVFQVASALDTGSASSVVLTNGAQACNVYWQVGSSATLGTASSFKGTILALTSITLTTGATVEGRALARNGAVTLDSNVFTAPGCATGPPPTTGTSTETATATSTTTSAAPGTSTSTPTVTATSTATGTATVNATPTTTAAPLAKTGAGTGGTGETNGRNQGADLDTAASVFPGGRAEIVALGIAIAGIGAAAGIVAGSRLLAGRRRNS